MEVVNMNWHRQQQPSLTFPRMAVSWDATNKQRRATCHGASLKSTSRKALPMRTHNSSQRPSLSVDGLLFFSKSDGRRAT